MVKFCCSEITGQGDWDSLCTFFLITQTFTQTVLIIYCWYSVLVNPACCLPQGLIFCLYWGDFRWLSFTSCNQGQTSNYNFIGSQKKTPWTTGWLLVSDHHFTGLLFANFKLCSVSSSALRQPTAYRPRLLLVGAQGSGQSSHLAPALLHHLDKLPVHRLDLPTLYSVSAKTPEESCAQVTHG